MVLGNVSGNWDWIICAVKLSGQPLASWWLRSNWISGKPLGLSGETVWDRSHSPWAAGTWSPYSAGQARVAPQSLLRNSPGHMWPADPGGVWGALCPLLQAGASVSGSSPCAAHFRLGASSGRVCERQSLAGFTGGFWISLLSGRCWHHRTQGPMGPAPASLSFAELFTLACLPQRSALFIALCSL